MNPHIAFLRGINVGGKNLLPMKDLAGLFESAGATKVCTYIQSGNAAFALDGQIPIGEFGTRVASRILARFGFEPALLILSLAELESAAAANPFREEILDPATMHLGFLARPAPRPDLDKLRTLKKDSERFQLLGKVFYLHAPEGIGRSKVAAATERCLGVPTTDRNMKTVAAVLDLARALG